MNEIRDVPRQLRLHVRRALPPVDRDPRPQRAARAGRAAAAARCCRRPASWPASTPAATSSAACYKAPANEVVCGLTRFEMNINTGPQRGAQPGGHQRAALLRGPRQPGLGRAHDELRPRVEVRQRPPAVHLPRALDRQGAPSGRCSSRTASRCGATSAATVEDFLESSGATARCSAASPRRRTSSAATARTMTQNDLDNGRLICLIGVAPVKPAEFVDLPHRPVDRRRPRLRRETAMATERDNPYGAFNFLVEFGDVGRRTARSSPASPTSPASATRSTTPSTATATRQFNTVRKVPNTFKLDEVTLKRGLVGSTDLFDWIKAVRDGAVPTAHGDHRACSTRPATRSLSLRAAQRPAEEVGRAHAGRQGRRRGGMEELHLVHEGIEYE